MQYKIFVEFTRELGDDSDVIGKKNPTDAELIEQFRDEMQASYTEGIIGGSFRILRVER